MPEPKLTFAEKARIVALEALGLKRSAALGADQPDIDRRIKRIRDQARRREQRGKK